MVRQHTDPQSQGNETVCWETSAVSVQWEGLPCKMILLHLCVNSSNAIQILLQLLAECTHALYCPDFSQQDLDWPLF